MVPSEKIFPFAVKITTQSIRRLKNERPIVAVTAYDAITAGLASEAGVDIILVGDSVGNTFLGFQTTVPVTLDMMLHHAAAVVRAKPDALVAVDIPFAIAHRDPDTAIAACARCLQETGADAVKIEGGVAMAPLIERLTRAGIPIIGHIGLMPQQVVRLGGYRRFGKTERGKSILHEDAAAIEAAGAFAIVGELIEEQTAATIAGKLGIPLIGIGSGNRCDGQILVSCDLLGLTPKPPSFVKPFANLADATRDAFRQYAEEVRNRNFPS